MNIYKLWIVEWSEQQRGFHIHQTEDAIRANLECFYHTRDPDLSDWRMVGIALSFPEAREIAKRLQASLDQPPQPD